MVQDDTMETERMKWKARTGEFRIREYRIQKIDLEPSEFEHEGDPKFDRGGRSLNTNYEPIDENFNSSS